MYHEYNRLFVPSFCLSRLFRSRCFRFPLAPRSRYWLIRLLYFRPPTAHEAPFAKDVGDMVCGLRNGPSDKTDNAAAASSVPSKRRLYFRTPLRESTGCSPLFLARSKICPFYTFWIRTRIRNLVCRPCLRRNGGPS